MKTQALFTLVLGIGLFFISSCNKDALVEDIRPLTSEYNVITEAAASVLERDSFEFSEIVELEMEEVLKDMDRFGSRGDRDAKGTMDSFGSRLPNQSIEGDESSRTQNWGSWDVDVKLIYDPNDNSVTGSIKIDYPDYGDYVKFEVAGQPAVVIVGDRDDETTQLQMQLTIVEGTGRFEDKTFEGLAAVLDVETLIAGSGPLRARVAIEGLLVDNPDGF